MGKSTGSVDRVLEAAHAAGLDIAVKGMPSSTRTAQEAADACGCVIGQIVKSLIFEGSTSGQLILLLVSGANQVDVQSVSRHIGEDLQRADPKRVRRETGFAIGGVAPIGHLKPVATWIDQALLEHDTVWAAAGSPHAVFDVNPKDLHKACAARVISVTSA